MVGHHHVRVQFDFTADFRRIDPFAGDYPSDIVQTHDSVYNIAKQARAAPRANGYKVRPPLRVIVSWQAKRLSLADRVVHGSSFTGGWTTLMCSARGES